MIEACLPFIQLRISKPLEMGPLHFWPAHLFPHILDSDLHTDFQRYMEHVRKVQVRAPGKAPIDIATLSLDEMTAISVHYKGTYESVHDLITDGIYLLYFALTFREHYRNGEGISFAAFCRLVPANATFIRDAVNWDDIHIMEHKRTPQLSFEPEKCPIFLWLGNALNQSLQGDENSRRIVRAIRYFVDCFRTPIDNPLSLDPDISHMLFEPEDILYLTAAFESILNLPDGTKRAHLKQNLRSILYLQFSKPMEVLWTWVEDFYDLKERSLAGGGVGKDEFTGNPNFRFPTTYLAIKLFIYVACIKLQMLEQKNQDFPRSDLVDLKEIIALLWPEYNILRRISSGMQKVANKGASTKLFETSIYWIMQVYTHMHHHFIREDCDSHPHVVFSSVDKEDVETHLQAIDELKAIPIENQNGVCPLHTLMPNAFIKTITARLDTV